MSRIGNFPIDVPKGVEVQFSPTEISVKGPLGTLKQALSDQGKLEKTENQLQFKVANESHAANALSGTMRALVANMVEGVTKGYQRKLTLVGVGYRAAAQGDKLNLTLGFSHPVVHQMPAGIKVETPTQTEILTKVINKQGLGQGAAGLRAN